MKRRLVDHGPWLLAVCFGVWQLWLLRHFLVDDSFIPLRYVLLWHRGEGITLRVPYRGIGTLDQPFGYYQRRCVDPSCPGPRNRP